MAKTIKWRQFAKRELAKVREFNVQAERTIQSYIDILEAKLPIAELEATQSASNARDDLARDLHDPATQDGPGATSKAAKLALVEGMIASKQHITDTVAALQARITQLEAENAAYRDALKPFVECVDNYDMKKMPDSAELWAHIFPEETPGDNLRVKHLRHAAEVYAKFEGDSE